MNIIKTTSINMKADALHAYNSAFVNMIFKYLFFWWAE